MHLADKLPRSVPDWYSKTASVFGDSLKLLTLRLTEILLHPIRFLEK